MPIHKDLLPALQATGKETKFSGSVFLTPGGNAPHEDSSKKPWLEAADSVGLAPRPRIHDLRHCWKTNAMRSGLHPDIADAIVGHGNKKKAPRTVYLSISDEDLVREIDRMKFDQGDTEIWLQK